MNKFYVYGHLREDKKQFFYIGKGKGRRAWQMSKRNNKHQNMVSKLNKLGSTVVVVILREFETEEEAFLFEIEMIEKLNPSCNLTFGGEGTSGLKWEEKSKLKLSKTAKGKTLSLEHRKKISIAHKGRKLPQEQVERMKQALKGNKNPFFGKTHTEEARRRMSEKKIGKKVSEEIRRRMSESHKGKVFSDEHRKNISLAKRKVKELETAGE